MMDRAIIAAKLGIDGTANIQTALEMFPFPEYLKDDYVGGVPFFLPFFTVLSLIYPAAILGTAAHSPPFPPGASFPTLFSRCLSLLTSSLLRSLAT